MSNTRMATMDFRDGDIANNPIVFLAIAHSSLDKGVYKNPDGSAAPYKTYRWTQHDLQRSDATFHVQNNGWFSAHDVTMIDRDLEDVWAVVFKRKQHNYLEYLHSEPGFWRTVEKDVVKEICNEAIEAADLFDDETTTPLLVAASDKAIDAMFARNDGRVIIRNWVHYKGHDNDPSISFAIGETDVKIDTDINSSSSRATSSASHHTRCHTERFGEQTTKQ